VTRQSIGLFRSRSSHSLDGKGRLNLPTRFREVVRSLSVSEQKLMITPWGKECLRAYTLPDWQALEDFLLKPGKKPPEMTRFIRNIIGSVEECNLDKNGRVILPARLRERCEMKKEVYVIGLLKYFEIWPGETMMAEDEKCTAEDMQVVVEVLQEAGELSGLL
jgi:MraZ protein